MKFISKSFLFILSRSKIYAPLCFFFLFIIEIKPPKKFKSDKDINLGLREGLLQLIGVNASNPYVSPPVVVTDLEKHTFVLYLTLKNENAILAYDLSIKLMDTFDEAIQFIQSTLSDRPSITRYFASSSPRTSPKTSPPKDKKEGSDDEDDDDDEDDMGFDLSKIQLLDKMRGEESFEQIDDNYDDDQDC